MDTTQNIFLKNTFPMKLEQSKNPIFYKKTITLLLNKINVTVENLTFYIT